MNCKPRIIRAMSSSESLVTGGGPGGSGASPDISTGDLGSGGKSFGMEKNSGGGRGRVVGICVLNFGVVVEVRFLGE
jgi:hypothetical protein